MKAKILGFFLVLIGVFTCCKDNEVVVEKFVEVRDTITIIKKDTITIIKRDTVYIEKKDDNKDKVSFDYNRRFRNNILVGEKVKFQITGITDKDYNKNIIYKIKTGGDDATQHQVFGEDFTLQNKDGAQIDDNFVIRDKNNIQPLYFIPKKPGTYDLKVSLQKYDVSKGENVGEPVIEYIAFFAVKITFDISVEKKKDGVLYNDYLMSFMFSIDDGERFKDNYLSNETFTENYTFRTEYEGEKISESENEDFVINKKFAFKKKPIEFKYSKYKSIDEAKEKELENHPKTVNITVIQHLKTGKKNIIEYKNVNIY